MKYYSILILWLLLANATLSQQSALTSAAREFIKTLNEQQKTATVLKLDTEERFNWHFIPKNNRAGISLAQLSDEQRSKAFHLLQLSLSARGFEKTREVIELEKVLKILENHSNDDYRNSGKYYLTIFGVPDANKVWGWRFEGHHVSFNFSARNGELVSGTPGFLGANPAIVPSGPAKGKQVLKEETEAGFELLRSFSGQQLETAISKSDAPNDIITSANRKANIDSNEGIRYEQLTREQQLRFIKLVELYVHRYTKLFADNMMKDIKQAGFNNLRFLWAGSRQADGKAYYYRIQGPTIIIEYDNSQNNANHIHTVVRDLKNDFGGDELLEHYKKEH